MDKKAKVLFVLGSAKVKLNGEARWIDQDGRVVATKRLEDLPEIECELEKTPTSLYGTESIAIRFSMDLPLGEDPEP